MFIRNDTDLTDASTDISHRKRMAGWNLMALSQALAGARNVCRAFDATGPKLLPVNLLSRKCTGGVIAQMHMWCNREAVTTFL